MTPRQCLRARELLGWSRVDLAAAANCAAETVKNFEERRRPTPAAIVLSIKCAVAAAGVLDVGENEISVRPRSKSDDA